MGKLKGCLLSLLVVFLVGCGQNVNQVPIEQNSVQEDSEKRDGSSDYILKVNTSEEKFKLNPQLYGLFFEDINKAADGGMNPELVENRSFEQHGTNKVLVAWTIEEDEANSYSIENEGGIHPNNPSYLKLTLKDQLVFNNGGYNGIPLKEGESYQFSLWLRNDTFRGTITANIEGRGHTLLSDQAVIEVEMIKKGEWTQYTTQIKATEQGVGNLIIRFEGAGTLDVDFISLMPETTWRGKDASKWPYQGLNVDLVESLKNVSPGFIRFPGGCIIEGEGLNNRYNWKDTIGPLEERKEQKNLWGYWQSYGLGYHEYFQLCEDLEVEPIPVVNAGISCQGRSPIQYEVPGSEALEQSIQDAIDLIEYANGDEQSYWGKKRIQNGHKESFNLKYIGIGNENWGKQYWANFKVFKERIQEKYPDIKIITSAGAWATGTEFTAAWKEINEKYIDTVADEHFYMTPEWFLANTNRYDYYSREGAKVFIGEYAAHSGRVHAQMPASGNTLYAALAEAAFMTGIERNGDIVELASYAPLFAKQGNTQWPYNLIWFNHYNQVYTPSYYVQKLFSEHLGDTLLASNLEKQNNEVESMQGGVLLGSWSTSVAYDSIQVISNKDGKVIFEDDFEDGVIDPIWKIKGGVWVEEEGMLKQTRLIEGETSVYIDQVDWSDYTVKVKAKKTSGKEGFLIGVGVTGPNDFIWYNAGGWGNTKDAVERSSVGIKGEFGTVEKNTFSPIKANTDYAIEMHYGKDELSVVKNDLMILKTPLKMSQKDIYTSVTQNSETHETFVKIVNTSNETVEMRLQLTDKRFIGEQKMSILTHDNAHAVNSFQAPFTVLPVEQVLSIGQDQVITLPPYSLQIITLSQKNK